MKAISWRVCAIIVLIIISYFVTHSWKEVTYITILYHGFQIFFYYVHERLWTKIPWGKKKHPLSDLPVKENITKEDLKIIAQKLKELGYIED